MTDLRKAAEITLDALRLYVTMYPQMDKGYMVDARETLRQALAQPEQPMSPEHLPRYVATNGVKPMEGGGGGGSQPEPDWTTDTPIPPFKYLDLPEYKTTQPKQEPVAWMLPDYGDVLPASEADGTGIYNIPLYTAPPKRKWQGLTDDEVNECSKLGLRDDVYKAIEAALRSKNT